MGSAWDEPVPQIRAVRAESKVGLDFASGLALEAFVAEHHPRLVALAGLVCGDLGDAEDIVQSALERAWRSRDSLRTDDSLRPWLDRIVVREAARERRSRLGRLARLIRHDAQHPGPMAEVVDRHASAFPDDTALRDAFDRLSRAHRAVVVLHLHAGHSVEETARILGIPVETARSRLRVARGRLRDALRETDA